jgi:hypothetical protein
MNISEEPLSHSDIPTPVVRLYPTSVLVSEPRRILVEVRTWKWWSLDAADGSRVAHYRIVHFPLARCCLILLSPVACAAQDLSILSYGLTLPHLIWVHCCDGCCLYAEVRRTNSCLLLCQSGPLSDEKSWRPLHDSLRPAGR